MEYAVMLHPGHNRVYYEASRKLAAAEFEIAAQKLSAPRENARLQTIAGIDYLTFVADGGLTEADIRLLSGLSFAYALFRLERREGEVCLVPMARRAEGFVDEGIGAMLKYTGKTNEIFTRMMLNIAYHSQGRAEDIRLLDPIAGKGTTLYEGLVKGFDAYGIEIGEKAVGEAWRFLKRYFETARYKFELSSQKMSGPHKAFTAARHTFTAARTKEAWKQKQTRTVEFIAGNSLYANRYYKRDFFDLIVGDLPYGVQHGNVTNEKQSSLTRNPAELLAACLPAWMEVLKPGGALVLSWNCHVLRRDRLEALLREKGLLVRAEGAYSQFEHRVDQAILRDIIVANKP